MPEFWLSDDGNLFVLRRFDLLPERQGFEDMAVLMGKPRDPQGHYKYQGSYEAIARIISAFSGSSTAANLKAFFASIALSVMVRNGDAHLKNFGLLYRDPSAREARLAPIYDPEDVIDRIATAMSETLAAHRPRLDHEYGRQLIAEWDGGLDALTSRRYFRTT